MEDFILREIDKIGISEQTDASQTVDTTTKTELVDRLDIDIETLLSEEDFIRALVEKHGFDTNHLELFAELLADLAAAAETPAEARKCAAAACAVYKYQDAHKAPVSIGRYYILKELAKYNP